MGERLGGGAGGRLLLTVRGAPGHSAHPDRAEPRRAPRTLRPDLMPLLSRTPDLWVPTPSGFPPSSPAGACISMPSILPAPRESPARPAPLASHPPKDPPRPHPRPLSLESLVPRPCLPRTGSSPSAPGSSFLPRFLPLPFCPHYSPPRPPPPISAPPPRPGCRVRRASLEQHQGPGVPTGWGRRAGSMGRGRPV